MMKVFLVAFFLFQYIYGIYSNSEAVNHFTGKLEIENSDHGPFINIISEEFKILDFRLEILYDNYRAFIYKFNINIHNSSESIKKLFTEGNEEVIREAAKDLNIRINIAIGNLNITNISLKTLKSNYQTIIETIFYDLKKNIYLLVNESLQIDEDIKNSNPKNISKLIESNYNTIVDSDETNEESTDLSKFKDSENNNKEDTPEGHAYAYSIYSSSKRIFRDNFILINKEETGKGFDDDKNGQFTKQRAMNVLLENSSIHIEGKIIEQKKENKGFFLIFVSDFSKRKMSNSFYSSNPSILRKNEMSSPFNQINNNSLNIILEKMKNILQSFSMLK